jgi:hypothetical protein
MIEKRVRKLALHESKKPAGDLSYWLSRPAEERIAAVDFLRVQYHGPQQDSKDVLACFNRSGVEYLIVGGYAVAFHGAPRYTGDLDVYVNPIRENARRIMTALRAFGFGGPDLDEEDFSAPGRVVQLGVPPVRIDIVTSIDGVNRDEAWTARTRGTYGDERVFFLGREDLVRNKRVLARMCRSFSRTPSLGIPPLRGRVPEKSAGEVRRKSASSATR